MASDFDSVIRGGTIMGSSGGTHCRGDVAVEDARNVATGAVPGGLVRSRVSA
jgi:N-acyl-D-aspartate/D-glutamate deacylase